MHPLHSARTVGFAVVPLLLLSSPAPAQNNSTGSGVWDGSFGSAPTRQDGQAPAPGTGVTNLSSSQGQEVQVIGGDALTLDGTALTANAIAVPTAGTHNVGVGGAGYAETAGTLNLGVSTLGNGTITMSDGRLDIGMLNGGTILQNGTLADTGSIHTFSVNGSYRDVSTLGNINNNNDSDAGDTLRQFYLPTDVYNPQTGAAGAAGLTSAVFPLHQAGGYLNIGHSGSETGTFTISDGELNVVQYGWNWATGPDVNWRADGTLNNNANDGANVSDATHVAGANHFEGYDLDVGAPATTGPTSTGGYVNGPTRANAAPSTNEVFVDVSELVDSYNQTAGVGSLAVTGSGGNGLYPFNDPNFAADWDNSGTGGLLSGLRGPFQDDESANSGPMGDGSAVDFYHAIGRSGGNIRVGNSGDAVGIFNVGGGKVTTNNLQIGRLSNAEGTVNMTGGSLYMREDIIMASDTTGTVGTFNFDGGQLETVDDLLIANTGTATFNLRDADGLSADATTSHVIIGDDIQLARSSATAVGIFNYDSPSVQLLPGVNRPGGGNNEILLGTRSQRSTANVAHGVFNYNDGAAEIGDIASGRIWDNLRVGNGIGSGDDAGGNENVFNHNNANTFHLDNQLIVGNSVDSIGIVNLNGTAVDGTGGFEVDNIVVVGNAGHGVFNQSNDTTVSAFNGTNSTDIVLGRYADRTENTGSLNNVNRDTTVLNPIDGTPLNPGIGSLGRSSGVYNLNDTAQITNVNNLHVGRDGVGQFNYASDENMTTRGVLYVGTLYDGEGEFNLTSDDVTIAADSGSGNNGTGPGGAIRVGYSGTGTFNQDGANTTVDPSLDSDLWIGGANGESGAGFYTEDRGAIRTVITDAGAGTYNLNGDGALVLLSGDGDIRLGDGDNASEGIKFDEGSPASTIDVAGDGDPIDIRNPWTGSHSTDSAQDSNNGPATLADFTGSPFKFGAASTVATEAAMNVTGGGTVTELNFIPGPDDGKGPIGTFNHNNTTDMTFGADNELRMAPGDNSLAFYNQNGASTVTIGATGGLEMSQDDYDTGTPTNAAAAAISTPKSFEMGQSTYSINHAGATLDLDGNNVVGDSIDVAAGRGLEVPDTYATTPTQGALHARDNEAQINLLDGSLINTRNVQADIYQFGGNFEMSESNGGIPVVTNLNANGDNHDYVQYGATANPLGFTNPLTGGSESSADGKIVFSLYDGGSIVDPFTFDFSTLDVTAGGTVNHSGSDLLIADEIDLHHGPGSIVVDLDPLSPFGFKEGQWWNLLDWTESLGDHSDSGAAFGEGGDNSITRFSAFDLPTLPGGLFWSVDPSVPATAAEFFAAGLLDDPLYWEDTWNTHGIIFIVGIPEPSRAMLLLLGLGTLVLRRQR